jgi:hypothetical protein
MSDFVHDAVSRGAKVICGGSPRPDLGPNFFEPTVITNVDSTMKLFQEETFGPILAVQTMPKKRLRARMTRRFHWLPAFGRATSSVAKRSHGA